MGNIHEPATQPGTTTRETGREGHPQTRDKDATRQRLLDAAEAVFAEKGYHGAVVDDIIRASDSSKGGFYFHFPNKQAIFLALIDALVPKLAATVDRAIAHEADPVAQLDAALRIVLETFSRHRRLSKILLVEAVGLGHGFDEKLMHTRGYFARMIQGYLDRAVAARGIAALDTELVSWAWFGAINEIVVRWLVAGQPRNLEDALPQLRALLLRSVGVSLPNDVSPLRAEEKLRPQPASGGCRAQREGEGRIGPGVGSEGVETA